MRSGMVGFGVAGLLAALVAAGSFIDSRESASAEREAEKEPVAHSDVVCPYVGGEAGDAHLSVLALPDVAVTEKEGDKSVISGTTLTPVSSEASPTPAPSEETGVLSLEKRGVVSSLEPTFDDPTSVVISADGELAPGVVAEQALLLRSADLRGLATASCTAAGREHWFVGASSGEGQRGRLIVTNPTDVTAVVDLELWGPEGPISAAGTKDVGIPARSQRVFLLDALAPDVSRTAVRVTTRQGKVAAALETRETKDLIAQGMSFVPEAQQPSREVLIPGTPGHGRRILRLLAPGETDAIVSVELLGEQGPFKPAENSVVTAKAGAVAEVALDVAGDKPVAVRLTSDQPITGAIRIEEAPSDGGLPDVAYTSATPALVGPTASLLGRSDDDVTSQLILSGVGDAATRVKLRYLAADGSTSSEESVDIPVGATRAVALKVADDKTHSVVVVEPETPGAVVAARETVGADDDGAFFDLMPLTTPAIEVDVPSVLPKSLIR